MSNQTTNNLRANAENTTNRENQQPIENYFLLKLIILSSFSCAAYCVYKGFDHAFNYSQPLHINTYVGGDAYNYIINSNFTTAYFVLALSCVVIASTCLIVYTLKTKDR